MSSSGLSSFNVSNETAFPQGTIAFVFNSTTWLLETWVLLPNAPTGTQLPANGRPDNHWQKA